MSGAGSVPGLSFFRAAYRRLLSLYPASFRDRYGREALGVFQEMYQAAYRESGSPGVVGLLFFSFRRGVAGALREWWSKDKIGGRGPRQDTPRSSSVWLRDRLRTGRNSMLRNPGFSGMAILLIALGIGATTTIFSVVHGVIIEDLPYPEPSELVFVSNGNHSPPIFRDFEEGIRSFESLAGVVRRDLDLTGASRPIRVSAGRVTVDFFTMFGGKASVGRLFSSDDHRTGLPDVVVLSHGFWQGRFGGDPAVIDETVVLDGRRLQIVGVLERDFRPPEVMAGRRVDLWTPFDLDAPEHRDRGLFMLAVAGRLASGRALESASAEMEELSDRLGERFPEDYLDRDGEPVRYPLIPLHEWTIGDFRNRLFLLLGSVGFLLAIASTNVANLMLARGSQRVRETALKGVLGASHRVITAELLFESALIALTGGAVGVLLAFGGVEAFKLLEPGGLPRIDSVAVDGQVLMFTFSVSVLTGLVCGVLPSIQALRTDPGTLLHRRSSKATAHRSSTRVQSFFVCGQVAFSLVLLVGAALLFHSFVRLLRVDPGFQMEQLATLQLELPPDYQPERTLAFTDELLQRAKALPGIREVGAGLSIPFQYTGASRCCWARSIASPDEPDRTVRVFLHPVSDGYFESLGVSMGSGRSFAEADGNLVPVPVVMSGAAVREIFPSGPALGRELDLGRGERAVVVGVVEGVRHWGLQEDDEIELYLPYSRFGGIDRQVSVLTRFEGSIDAIVPTLREVVWAVDPDLPIGEVVPMTELVGRSVAEERFFTVLFGLFGIVAIILVVCGIYAIVAYSVRRRRREVGIRMAVGASSSQIVRGVMGRGAALTGVGLVVGLLCSLWLARFLEGMVYGITTTDVTTLSAACLFLGMTAMISCYLPALRAGRTDPRETLQAE